MEIEHALDLLAQALQEVESRSDGFRREPDYLPLARAVHDLMIAAKHSAGQSAAFYLECFETTGRRRIEQRRREEEQQQELAALPRL